MKTFFKLIIAVIAILFLLQAAWIGLEHYARKGPGHTAIVFILLRPDLW